VISQKGFLHMHLTLSHLMCKNVHPSSHHPKWTKVVWPTCQEQIFKIIFEMFVCLSPPHLHSWPNTTWVSNWDWFWFLFSFRCAANVIGIRRSFLQLDVFCNNKIWLKFLIKFMKVPGGKWHANAGFRPALGQSVHVSLLLLPRFSGGQLQMCLLPSWLNYATADVWNLNCPWVRRCEAKGYAAEWDVITK